MYRLMLAMILLMPVVLPADMLRPDAKTIVHSASEQLAEQLRAAHPGYSRIEVIPVGAMPRLPASANEVVTRMPSELRLRNRVCIWLDVRQRARVVKSIPVWFEVRAYKSVPVTARALRPKEALRAPDVLLQEREIAGLQDTLMDGLPPSGSRARRYLAAGSMLRAADLEPLPPVLSSQRVAVRVVTGSVVIETTGIAEQEGWPGDTIRIRNASSDTSFSAQVTNDSRVEVVTR
jgi:flagella basal body P-ring formation protein FlgA